VAISRVPDVVNAAVDALAASAALTALTTTAKVYTHVPKGTGSSYVQIIGGDEVPWAETMSNDFGSPATFDTGDSGGRMVDLLALCASTFRGFDQVDDMASAVMDTLTDDATWTGVGGFQIAAFISNRAQQPQDIFGDGVMWFIRTVTIRVTLA
jgi:hypothetical protein